MSMKILIGIHYFPPHVGGMEIVAKTQAELLARRGHDVTVLTSSASSSAGESHENGYRLLRLSVWNFFERYMGVPFPFFAPSLLWKSYQMVRQSDVVHLHDVFYQTSFVIAFWAKILKKPVIVTQHVDMIPHPNPLVTFVQWVVYRTTGNFVFSVSKRVAILNSTVERFLLSIGVKKEKIVFVPNGVDMTIFHPDDTIDVAVVRTRYDLPIDMPIALFVGRFVPKKGFDKLIQSASDAYHIAFAGGSKPKNAADNPTLSFLGSLSPQQLAELYNAVDIFILPSSGEGFPLTVQEAMASRLPIVISHNPGYDVYDFDPTLLLQIDPTVEEIKSSLTTLATSPDKRKKMADYAYDYAEKHFSWDANITHVETLYKEVHV